MRPPRRRSGCPLNAALEMLGDRWSLLIVRDMMFRGLATFGQFLEADGVVERRRDPEDARRVRYRLTEKGMDLAPALVELIVWGARHEETAAPPAVLREMTGRRSRFLARLRRRWAGAAAD